MMMIPDSSTSYRIPQYLYDKQSNFFIKFIQLQDEDHYDINASIQDHSTPKDTSDKIVQVTCTKNYYPQKIITSNHLLKANHIKKTDYYTRSANEDWLGSSIVICLILFSFARFFYFKRLSQVFSALFVNRIYSQINRENYLKKEGISFLLMIIFLICTALFLYNISINHFNLSVLQNNHTITFFFIILGVIFLFYLIKYLLIRFIGFVFNTQNETNDYILFSLISLMILGSVLLIPVIIQCYISYKVGLYMAIFIIIISVGFRLFKLVISLFSSSKFSVLFIFLYLCTVEIIPVMVIYKVLLNFIKT